MVKEKVLVIGLDGATFDILKPWIDGGLLPNLKKIQETGMSGNLTSVLPLNSYAAWSSFATGLLPGNHGVFGFEQFSRKDKKRYITSSLDLKAKTLWEILSEAGKRVIVINVPLTYPPKKINGIMIAGLGAPKIFTYPEKFADELEAKGYVVEPKGFVVTPKDEFLKDLYFAHEKRFEIALDLLKKYKWDMFVIVFSETDRIQHYFWKDMENNDKKYGREILKFYKNVDDKIGKLLDSIDENTIVVILSDHGFGLLKKKIYLDNWLWKEKYAKLSLAGSFIFTIVRILQKVSLVKLVKRFLQLLGMRGAEFLVPLTKVDINKSIAFTSSFYEAPIYLNENLVDENRYKSKLNEIVGKLKELKDDNGNRILKNIYTNLDAYGKFSVSDSPDILIEPEDGYMCVGGFGFDGMIADVESEEGNHRMNGILMINGRKIKTGKIIGARIIDVAPTILKIFGIKYPGLDGRVLDEIFT